MKTYFITGISGFLGRNLTIKLLKQKDINIIGLVFPNEKNLDFYRQYSNIQLAEGNILNKDDVKRFLSTPRSGEKIVIHLAGKISLFKKGDSNCMSVNVDGTKNMVDTSLEVGCDKFIYISSVDSLSRVKGNDVITEQDYYDENKVIGVYSKSKAIANNYVLDACKRGLKASIMLPTVFIGPNDPFNSPINLAVKKFLKGKLPALVKGQYDVADVRDVADGIMNAITNARPGESYILSGHQIKMIDLINKVAILENRKPVKLLIPVFLIKLISPFVELHAKIHRKTPLFTGFSMDCLKQNSNYSSSKAVKELGYNSREIDDTLSDLVKWMKESDYLAR